MPNRKTLLAAWSVLLGVVALALPPIAQPARYHAFADQRLIGGVPHFGDVISNLAFLFVGLAGLAALLFGHTRHVFGDPKERLPYLAFFAGVALIGAGSAYYHWAPSNTTLFWDRATMSLAFMALFASVVADRVDTRFGIRFALPALLLVGLSAVAWWRFSGDVRFYFVLGQVWPLSSVILVVFLLFPKGTYVSTRHVALIGLLYASAVAFEASDMAIWDLSRQVVSGHSLKHLAAAASVSVVLPMLARLREADDAKRPARAGFATRLRRRVERGNALRRDPQG